MVSKSIAIKAPIESIYNVIVDFESYPDFLPDMKGAKIDWCEDHQMDVTFRLNLIKDITYTLRFTLSPHSHVQWELKRGDWMKKNTGSWTLEELEPGLIDAKYDLDVEFGLWVPKSVTETLVSKSLPDTLKRFKERSEEKSKKRPAKKKKNE